MPSPWPDAAPRKATAMGRSCVGAVPGRVCRASGGVSGRTAGTCLAVVLAGPGLPQPVGF